MRFFTSLAQVPEDFGPSAITIGKFDGVHLGHRTVLTALRDVATERGLTSTVLTFDRNPLSLLDPANCPTALVSNDQKRALLADTGIDATVMLAFDRAFSRLPAEQFVEDVLAHALHARVVLIGPDFRFGAHGFGEVGLLTELGREMGFEVRVLQAIKSGSTRRISATWIRRLLTEGDVATAARLLGRPCSIRAVVVHGQQRGKSLGFPTANLSPQIEGFVPADGVYAGWLTVDRDRLPSAISIGNNPTFTGVPDRQVEAHVLDADLDLYDRTVELSFIQRIRPMRKFASLDELIDQIGQDVAVARRILTETVDPITN